MEHNMKITPQEINGAEEILISVFLSACKVVSLNETLLSERLRNLIIVLILRWFVTFGNSWQYS